MKPNCHIKYICSFCHNDNEHDDVQFMVAGDEETVICDKCVELCRDIIGEQRRKHTKLRADKGE